MRTLKGIEKLFGLMFVNKNIAEPVCFEFKRECLTKIHTWFVKFPVYLVWEDVEGNIIETRRVEPWSSGIKPNRPFNKLKEYPIITKEEMEES